QKKLINLRELEQSHKVKFKSFKEAELQNTYLGLKQLQQSEAEGKELIATQQIELDKLQIAIKNLPAEEDDIKKGYDKADANFNMFNRYEELANSIEKLGEDINELKMFIL